MAEHGGFHIYATCRSDEEVAGLIAYLYSPSAEYITGQSINIAGGVVMW